MSVLVTFLAFFFFLCIDHTRDVVLGQEAPVESYFCNVSADECNSQMDGVCDSSLGTNPLAGCETGDCMDCNLCQQFNYDCQGCLNATGCFWCPGDATCNNSPDYDFGPSVQQSCTDPQSYLSGGDVCSLSPDDNFFSDPLFDGQKWVYDMIRVEPVWQRGYFGKGVRIRINDYGVDLDHDEFQGRIDSNASCDVALPVDGDLESHGTAVASILGGAANNDKCAAGIAPEVSMSSCNIFAEGVPLSVLSEKLDTFDISQNSWALPGCANRVLGERNRQLQTESCPFKYVLDEMSYDHPCDVCDFQQETVSADCEASIVSHCDTYKHFENDAEACLDFLNLILGGGCNYDRLPQSVLEDITKGITEGRNGKGIVYIFASGNSYATGDDVNFGALTNSRFTITVGGVGKDGLHASYSTSGAALFVSAPGSDFESISSHMAAANGGGCKSTEPGTSFSSPVVTGVVALMLEANPLLTWRDVQGILATTSQPVDDPDDTTVTTNAAGNWHSNFYGFGIIDAEAAVTAAANWTLYSNETFIIGESGWVNETVADDPTSTISSNITVAGTIEGEDLIVESVAVLLHLEHFSRGDLEIILTSPSGTVSVLHGGCRIENTQQSPDERWMLLSVRNWGEYAVGEWMLSIRDLSPGSVNACADAPFYSIYDDEALTCGRVETELWCVDGERSTEPNGEEDDLGMFEVEDNGMTIVQACCICGGGRNSSVVNDIFLQWRLALHGQQNGGFSTPNGNLRPVDSGITSNTANVTNATSSPDPSPSTSPTPLRPSSVSSPSTTPSNKPTSTELAIAIVGTVSVFLVVTLAVWWSCQPPAVTSKAAKFQAINESIEIA
eukprot:CAMPEP_0178775504 /NCGR_PEP_ID=MMETSP0744-20121128/24230_1 /TAXON_ID=913974 /ORGANISM="Nitzschia punctata, Strain CCMP561" /LENGTH=842 /DNA_ID=CAMNT_0020432491 /DNA_START=72 /DNA_END=2600 /DNA_ORIENTATION=+